MILSKSTTIWSVNQANATHTWSITSSALWHPVSWPSLGCLPEYILNWSEFNSTAYEGPEDFSQNNSFHSVERRVETLVTHYRLQVDSGSCPFSLNSGVPLGFELWITSWQTHAQVQSWCCSRKPHPLTAQRKRILFHHCSLLVCVSLMLLGFLGSIFIGFFHDLHSKKFSCFQMFDLRWIFSVWKPPQEKFCVLLSFILSSDVVEAH